jgi:Amt family ammonium transporter
MIGLFADAEYFGAEHMSGLFYGGGFRLLGEQAIANGVTIVYSAVVTALILLALKATIGIRVSEEEEEVGLDISEHAETAYQSDSTTMERA